MFNWALFWEDHPKKEENSLLWKNLRPDRYDYEQAFDQVDQLMKFSKYDNVLEVGCGSFEFYPYLKDKCKFIVGVDWSREMVSLAYKRHQVHIVHSAANNLTMFYDEQFDKVITMALIQYVPRNMFEATISELLRVTAEGGKLLIGDIVEVAPKDSEVFGYSKSDFEEIYNRLKSKYNLKHFKFSKSVFEDRPHLIIGR
jgi:ubiquinone/menaquinone biosynthesis C-methylase UbiE